MDSLQDLLGRFSRQEPDEALAIKQYIDTAFAMPSSVVVQETSVVIIVQSAALANALRLKHRDLQAIAGEKRRIIFRIGS